MRGRVTTRTGGRSHGGSGSRAQSEVTGSVLLIGVFAVVITVSGGLVLANFVQTAAVDGPRVDLAATANETNVTLIHGGGSVLDPDEVTVSLEWGDSGQEWSLSAWSFHRDDGDGRFEPGERATGPNPYGFGRLDLLVVHRPSGSVLLEETLRPVPNRPPTASFTVSCGGLTCTFDASGSSDSDGHVYYYDWEFGDGNTSSGETTTHRYAARGLYTVNLTVTDDDDATDDASQQVDAVPYPPTIAAVLVSDRSANSYADYRVNYDVDNTTEFDRVEVEFDNQANDWSDATETNASARGYVTYSEGGTEGDTYDITVRAYNGTDARPSVVTDSVTITDVADGDDSGEGNFSSPGGPEFAGVAVDDASTVDATYEVSYNVTNRSEFGHVELVVENLDSTWATATYSSTDPRHNLDDYSESTYGDGYEVSIALVDSAGVVVDSVSVADAADGTDPAGNDDLSRPGSPDLSNWVITDDSTSGAGASYDVTYVANDTAEFAGVEVIFRNRDSQSASEVSPVSGDATGTISHQPGYAYGSQYDIEVRVIDTDGIVVDEYAVSDVADGSDPSGNNPPSSPADPAFAGVVVDDASVTEATYEVSYNVTNRSTFDHVEVEVENLDSSWASATYSSTDPRNNVDDYSESTYGESYRITVSLVDDAGFVVDQVVVADAADGTDPAGNDDLSRPGSPSLSSYTISDQSLPWAAEYEVQYSATGTPEFAGVEIVFRNRDDRWASEVSPLQTSTSGSYTHSPGYGGGNQYEIEIRVVDTDGIVVDEVIVSDSADGTDP